MCAIDSTITRFNAPIQAKATPNVYQRTRYAMARLTVWMAVMNPSIYVLFFRKVSEAVLIHLSCEYTINFIGMTISRNYNQFYFLDTKPAPDVRGGCTNPGGCTTDPKYCCSMRNGIVPPGYPRQCISHTKVCDSKIDCMDGSDESSQKCGADWPQGEQGSSYLF